MKATGQLEGPRQTERQEWKRNTERRDRDEESEKGKNDGVRPVDEQRPRAEREIKKIGGCVLSRRR